MVVNIPAETLLGNLFLWLPKTKFPISHIRKAANSIEKEVNEKVFDKGYPWITVFVNVDKPSLISAVNDNPGLFVWPKGSSSIEASKEMSNLEYIRDVNTVINSRLPVEVESVFYEAVAKYCEKYNQEG